MYALKWLPILIISSFPGRSGPLCNFNMEKLNLYGRSGGFLRLCLLCYINGLLRGADDLLLPLPCWPGLCVVRTNTDGLIVRVKWSRLGMPRLNEV